MKVFTCNIQYDRRRGRKGRLQEGNDVRRRRRPRFRPHLKPPPHRRRQRPNPTRRKGAAPRRRPKGRRPGEASGEPVGESAPHRNRQCRPAAGRTGQLHHENQPGEGERQMAGRRGPGSEESPVAQPTNVPTPCRAGPATITPRNTSSSLRVELSPSRPVPSPPWISVKPHHWHRARKTQDAAMGAPSTKRL